jgi:hypothetical protein
MPIPTEVPAIRRRRFTTLLGAAASLATVFLATGSASAAAPANDNVANAPSIPTPGGTVNGTNAGATAESGEPRGSDFLGRPASTVWYTWTSPAQPAQLTIDACQGATYHMILAVYKKVADPVPPFGNLSDKGAVGEDPGPNAGCSGEYGAAGLITPDPCSTYYIQISGFAATEPPSGDRGPFTMKLSGGGSGSCTATPPPGTGSSTPPPAPSTKKKKKKGASKKKCKKAKKGSASAAKKKCKKK